MLHFIRILRRKLIEQGNIRRYLVYGLGEILLVALGILLALQVNNWNQSQKNRELSKLYVENFIKSVESDIVFLND